MIKAPECTEIKFENAVAHGKKEQWGSEKGREPNFVLEIPKLLFESKDSSALFFL